MSEWERGFAAGWRAHETGTSRGKEIITHSIGPIPGPAKRNPSPVRRQSAKQKLLKKMTDAKWKKYKRGNGKKTWIQIRAEVSRSQLYKKKARRL